MPSLLVEKLQIDASIPEHADEIHLIRRRSHHSPFLKSFEIMTDSPRGIDLRINLPTVILSITNSIFFQI